MTYIVNEKCIKCKYTDCVEVCPVDCFYEGDNMLVINPDEADLPLRCGTSSVTDARAIHDLSGRTGQASLGSSRHR